MSKNNTYKRNNRYIINYYGNQFTSSLSLSLFWAFFEDLLINFKAHHAATLRRRSQSLQQGAGEHASAHANLCHLGAARKGES